MQFKAKLFEERTIFAVKLLESRHADAISQSDLQRAIADMRDKSYHGFVILLNIINAVPKPLQRLKRVTFFMPGDRQLSAVSSLTRDSLQDFILRHSILSGFTLDELRHLPNGTLIPSGSPRRMISITNSMGSEVLLNGARITTPDVCRGPNIRCHGISSQIEYSDAVDYPRASNITARTH
ncbi:hypothetical protein SAY87_008177 [Trapa incisa]|uniref:FAS1 domain-containing protein n=1 Tax=Trapa incisa TaxID=236973 RepID=A0AAN7QJ37_9MYRT|nr:hypothetical protein SAY87_008177 [Trapa incisa]